MTLQDIIDLLLAGDSAQIPRDVAITRAVLLAYELGLAQGRREAHAVAHARADSDAEQRAHDRAVAHQRREEDEA